MSSRSRKRTFKPKKRVKKEKESSSFLEYASETRINPSAQVNKQRKAIRRIDSTTMLELEREKQRAAAEEMSRIKKEERVREEQEKALEQQRVDAEKVKKTEAQQSGFELLVFFVHNSIQRSQIEAFREMRFEAYQISLKEEIADSMRVKTLKVRLLRSLFLYKDAKQWE